MREEPKMAIHNLRGDTFLLKTKKTDVKSLLRLRTYTHCEG